MTVPTAKIFLAGLGPTTEILWALFLMLLAAKLAAELFERLQQPTVVGEILAGVIIGPSVLGLVVPSEFVSMLAEIGVIFLLFSVGLETKPSSIFQVGKTAVLVAALGVILPFFGGWLLMRLWGATNIGSLFVGTALVATSVGITARVLASLQLLNTPVLASSSVPQSLTIFLDYWCYQSSPALRRVLSTIGNLVLRLYWHLDSLRSWRLSELV